MTQTGLIQLYDGSVITEPFDVRRYGAVLDGTTDDTAAVLAASAAAGVGGTVVFPAGRCVLAGDTLTGIPAQQTWEGAGFQFGVGDTTAVTELRFTGLTGTQVGVTAGVNHVFKNLLFRGPGNVGTVVGVKSTVGTPQFHDCQFYSFPVANDIQNAYYTKYWGCEFAYNVLGIKTTGCYNMHLFGVTFRGAFSTAGYFSDCIYVTDVIRHLTVLGGSMEGYDGTGAIRLPGGSLLDVIGVYFESSEATSGSFGIVVTGTSSTVNLIGNLVYLTNANRWFTASGLNGITVNGRGNKFECSAGSGTSPIAYILPTNGTAGTVNLIGDDWSDVAHAATYSAAVNSGAVQGFHIQMPDGVSTTFAPHEHLGRAPVHVIRTAAPAAPIKGAIYWADAATWDPIGIGGSIPYPVAYDNSHYRAMGTLYPVGSSAITYSTSMTPNAAAGERQVITATDGVAFAINAPSNPVKGQKLVFSIRNTSGGALGTITWDSVFKMAAWTSPATGNNRSISFWYDGTNWIETNRASADIPN